MAATNHTINLFNKNIQFVGNPHYFVGYDGNESNICIPQDVSTNQNNQQYLYSFATTTLCKLYISGKQNINKDFLSTVIYFHWDGKITRLVENIEYTYEEKINEYNNENIVVVCVNIVEDLADKYVIVEAIDKHVSISVNYTEASNETPSNVVTYDNISSLGKNVTVVHSIPVSQPLVQSNSRVIYIEDSINNTDKVEYSHFTRLKTANGENIYGVKRLPFFVNGYDEEEYVAKYKHNIDAEIVVLNPKSTQRQIYSFKNGPQYAEINKTALKYNEDSELDGKIIPHYIHSYEYIIDSTIPKSDDTNDTNLRFYGSNGILGAESRVKEYITVGDIMNVLANSTDDEINSILSYTFTVDYKKTENTNYGGGNYDEDNESYYGFEKVRTITELTPVQNNIDNASSCSKIYENTYVNIDENKIDVYKKYVDVIELYVRSVAYEPLKLNTHYTPNDIATNISVFENAYQGQNVFYKFDDKIKQYVPVDNTVASNSKLYAKCISYTKVSPNIDAFFESSSYRGIASIKDTYYVQEYDYKLVDDKEHIATKELYYIKKEDSGVNVFFPVQPGIVSDGSTNYYSFTYVKLTAERVTEMKENASEYPDTYAYIKLDYSRKRLDEFTEFDFNNMYTYEGNSVIYENLLSNNDYIFNVDPSGTTIYSSASNESCVVNPIDKSDLEEMFFYDSDNNENKWINKDIQSETALDNLHKYSLPANYGINGTLNYKGKWIKIDRRKLRDTYKSEEAVNEYINDLDFNGKLFVKEPGYAQIALSEMVVGYDVDFYAWEIGKIEPSGVTIDAFMLDDPTKKIYVDAQKFVDESNKNIVEINSDKTCKLLEINKFGLIKDESIKYYTRIPNKNVSYDLYYFINKEYYFRKNSNVTVITGTTPKIPVALMTYVGLNTNSEQISGNITSFTADQNCTYMKIKNDFALHILRNCQYADKLFYMNNGTYEQVSELSEAKDVEYLESILTTSYYLRVSNFAKPSGIVSFSDSDQVQLCDQSLFDGYSFLDGTVKFYKDSIAQYDLNGEFIKKSDIMSYDNKFLYSKYFYPDLTVNNGIHVGKNGSYYTSISVYDADRGKISRTLALQPNVFNITEYTYEYTVTALIDIDYDEDLRNVTQSHYSDYYIYGDDVDGLQQLNSEGHSPTYYQNYFANLNGVNHIAMYKERTKTEKYDGHSFGPPEKLSVQYFDNVTFEPKVIQKNNTMFGIIFHTNLLDFIEDGNVVKSDDMIIHPLSKTFMSPLYYDLDTTLSYEYDVVPLKEYITEDYNMINNMTVIQPNKVISKDITIPTPLHLGNEIQAEFTGTYHWNMPEHSYVFVQNSDGEYVAQDIIKTTGYWERDYKYNTQLFKIASYNFYSDPTKISNTTVSYTFTPESYVVSGVSVHPEISYKYIVDETREIERYSYTINGKEYEYPSTSKVQINDDGTYTGVVNILTGEDRITPMLVELVKYIEVDVSPVVKDIVHQESNTTYNMFSYKTSIALANERVPVLYGTEIIPATTHKILYWNEDAESYAIKTVVDTYAYYSYNYKLDLVPFVVSSYVSQQAPFVIENMYDLSQGAYSIASNIVSVSQANASGFNDVKETINNLNNDLTNSLSSTYNQISAFSKSLNNSLDKVADYIKTYSGCTRDVVTAQNTQDASNTQNTVMSTYEFTESISSLENAVVSLKNTIDNKLSYMTKSIVETVNNTLINNSESIEKIISKTSNSSGDLVTRDYEGFMIELTKMMYSKLDFDKEIIETERRDENGNILERASKKANPIALAKATIYRADILWNELKKKNIV